MFEDDVQDAKQALQKNGHMTRDELFEEMDVKTKGRVSDAMRRLRYRDEARFRDGEFYLID
jgi:hypothetical protein